MKFFVPRHANPSANWSISAFVLRIAWWRVSDCTNPILSSKVMHVGGLDIPHSISSLKWQVYTSFNESTVLADTSWKCNENERLKKRKEEMIA